MIVLPIIRLDKYTKAEQLDKIKEEVQEVFDSMVDTSDRGRMETLQECFDIIQATIGLMLKVGTKSEIELAAANHFVKLQRRGWVNQGQIEMFFK